VPNRQSREIHAVVAAGWIAEIEEESGEEDRVAGLAVAHRRTGRERRRLLSSSAAEEESGVTRGDMAGHFVVKRGKRDGSKAAGLAAKAVSRAVARKVS
jgi:hypothetical protein